MALSISSKKMEPFLKDIMINKFPMATFAISIVLVTWSFWAVFSWNFDQCLLEVSSFLRIWDSKRTQ